MNSVKKLSSQSRKALFIFWDRVLDLLYDLYKNGQNPLYVASCDERRPFIQKRIQKKKRFVQLQVKTSHFLLNLPNPTPKERAYHEGRQKLCFASKGDGDQDLWSSFHWGAENLCPGLHFASSMSLEGSRTQSLCYRFLELGGTLEAAQGFGGTSCSYFCPPKNNQKQTKQWLTSAFLWWEG